MSNHDTHNEELTGMDKFVPLSDNNDNLSLSKSLTLIVSLALVLISIVTFIVKTRGYLKNEEQVEWRIKNHETFKDSHENTFYKTEADAHNAENHEVNGEEKHDTEVKGEEKKAEEGKMEEKKTEEKKPEEKMDSHKH